MEFKTMYKNAMETYAKRTLKSGEAYQIAKKYMTGGETRTIVFFPPHPLTIDYGKDAYIYDIDGNRYIDFLNNYTSMIHGHAHPEIVNKSIEIIDKGTCYGSAIEDQIELSNMLCERVPSFERIRFCNSGTEAVLFAIRAARAYTKKTGIIKMEGGFHGSCDLVQHSISPNLSLKDNENPWKGYADCLGVPEDVTKDVYVAPFNNADVVYDILKANSDKIAAIIVEPALGQTGAIPPHPGYLKRLRELADQFKVVLIFDEVQSFRIGYKGVQGLEGVTPDISTVGKFVGGGYPMAVFGGKKEIMSIYDPNENVHIAHSGTFNGNKLAMATGVVSLNLLDEKTIERINEYAKILKDGIDSIIKSLEIPVSVAIVGSLLHIHFTKEVPTDYASTVNTYNDYKKVMHMELLNRGIFIAPRGSINISTVMTIDDISFAINAFKEVLPMIKPLFQNEALN